MSIDYNALLKQYRDNGVISQYLTAMVHILLPRRLVRTPQRQNRLSRIINCGWTGTERLTGLS